MKAFCRTSVLSPQPNSKVSLEQEEREEKKGRNHATIPSPAELPLKVPDVIKHALCVRSLSPVYPRPHFSLDGKTQKHPNWGRSPCAPCLTSNEAFLFSLVELEPCTCTTPLFPAAFHSDRSRGRWRDVRVGWALTWRLLVVLAQSTCFINLRPVLCTQHLVHLILMY